MSKRWMAIAALAGAAYVAVTVSFTGAGNKGIVRAAEMGASEITVISEYEYVAEEDTQMFEDSVEGDAELTDDVDMESETESELMDHEEGKTESEPDGDEESEAESLTESEEEDMTEPAAEPEIEIQDPAGSETLNPAMQGEAFAESGADPGTESKTDAQVNTQKSGFEAKDAGQVSRRKDCGEDTVYLSSCPVKPVDDDAKALAQYSEDEIYLFAAIIECEAGGTSYEGMLGVASVVMNRVESEVWPDTIHDVVYQKGQFSPARSGVLAKRLANGNISEDAYKAAKAAICGERNTDCYFFWAAYTGHKGTVIGGNVFF